MQIFINDEPHEIESRITISQLLQQQNRQARYLAVERNKELVPRSEHADCVLEAGDHLEIVTLVGGG